jgi:hypothetical protein
MAGKAFILRLTLACALTSVTGASAQLFLPQEGRPVRSNDFSGKTICWSNGHVASYGANGHFANNVGVESTWSVTEPGTLRTGRKYYEADVQQDGQVHLHWLILRSKHNPVRDLWGKYCDTAVD